MKKPVKVLILATPRTGSNALCEVLTRAQVWGRVDGFFVGYGESLKNNFEEKADQWHEDHKGTRGAMHKVMWDYVDHLTEHAGADAVQRWMNSHTHIVALYRGDTIAQAVSWHLAAGSGKWTSKNPIMKLMPDYEFDPIAWRVAEIDGLNARTVSYCNLLGVEPLKLYYEALVGDWAGAVGDIYEYVFETPFTPSPTHDLTPDLEKQVNELKPKYRNFFLQDLEARYKQKANT